MDVPEAETLHGKIQLRQKEHRLRVLNLAIKYRNRKVRVLFNFLLLFFFDPKRRDLLFFTKKERHLIPEKKNKEQRTKKCRIKLYDYY